MDYRNSDQISEDLGKKYAGISRMWGGSERKVMLSEKYQCVGCGNRLAKEGRARTLNYGIYSKSNRESPRNFYQKNDKQGFVLWKEYSGNSQQGVEVEETTQENMKRERRSLG